MTYNWDINPLTIPYAIVITIRLIGIRQVRTVVYRIINLISIRIARFVITAKGSRSDETTNKVTAGRRSCVVKRIIIASISDTITISIDLIGINGEYAIINKVIDRITVTVDSNIGV